MSCPHCGMNCACFANDEIIELQEEIKRLRAMPLLDLEGLETKIASLWPPGMCSSSDVERLVYFRELTKPFIKLPSETTT